MVSTESYPNLSSLVQQLVMADAVPAASDRTLARVNQVCART